MRSFQLAPWYVVIPVLLFGIIYTGVMLVLLS